MFAIKERYIVDETGARVGVVLDISDYQRLLEAAQARPSLMSQLKEIAIEAPADFAANHDLYVTGEKHAGPHPD